MTWPTAVETFQRQLKSQNTFLNNPHLPLATKEKRLNRLMKGAKFLTSMEELNSLVSFVTIDRNSNFMELFLNNAATTLAHPTSPNYDSLHLQLVNMKRVLENDSAWNKFSVGFSASFDMVGMVASAGTITYGVILIQCVVAATCTLAMGPGAAVALAIGLIILGGIAAGICAHRLHKKGRFCIDSQLDEIKDFIEDFRPNAAQGNITPNETQPGLEFPADLAFS